MLGTSSLSLSSVGVPEDISGGEAVQPWAVVVPWEGQRWELLRELLLASMGLQQK